MYDIHIYLETDLGKATVCGVMASYDTPSIIHHVGFVQDAPLVSILLKFQRRVAQTQICHMVLTHPGNRIHCHLHRAFL
jgi:hypothetical protein